MSVEFEIHGLEQLQSKLERLRNKKRVKNIARKAARQAMNIVRDAARNNAKAVDDPKSKDKIWKNIAVQAAKSRNPNEIKIRVGVKGGASFSNREVPKLSGGDTRHWRWLEFGSSNNIAKPFMRPALSNNLQAVTNKFVEVFNVELDKEIDRQ